MGKSQGNESQGHGTVWDGPEGHEVHAEEAEWRASEQRGENAEQGCRQGHQSEDAHGEEEEVAGGKQ
jgi:hypothetical protein